MASRGFFGYDPYDYYYTVPSPYHHYPYPASYYQQQQQRPAAAPARSRGGFFPVEPAVREAAQPRPSPAPRSVSIPVHFVGSDPQPEREMETARKPSAAPAPVVAPRKRAVPSKEEAAVRIQAAARGLAARRAVREVREVEREAGEVAEKVAREAEALRGDARGRIAVGEALMRLLLRLDAVRGARDYRKRVTKRVLAIQDAVDALEPKAAEPTAVMVEPEAENAADGMEEESDTKAVPGEMAEENKVKADQPDATEQSSVTEAAAEMEVDGASAAAVDENGAAEETDPAPADLGADTPADAEGAWEMVTDEPAVEAESSMVEPPRPQEPAATGEEEAKTAAAGAEPNNGNGGVDARKVMEMVAALCERNAQQCAVIGALAERVDSLERAVRRVEDAERRSRRGKKLRKKEGKGSNPSKFYTD